MDAAFASVVVVVFVVVFSAIVRVVIVVGQSRTRHTSLFHRYRSRCAYCVRSSVVVAVPAAAAVIVAPVAACCLVIAVAVCFPRSYHFVVVRFAVVVVCGLL